MKPNNETTEYDQSSLSSSLSGISTRSSSRLIAKRQHEERDDHSTKKQKFVEESSSINKVESQKTRRRSARLNNKNQSRTEEFEGGAKICPENQDKKPSKSDIENSKKTNISKTEYLVHPEHRLKRDTFDGINHTQGIAPHDENVDDVLKVAPYATDLYQHWYHVEGRCCPRMYMDNQPDINAKMRAILIDWLAEVHMKFRLAPETFYLCVNLIDRFLTIKKIARSKLQLVGITALLIACKYEEIYPPEVGDCVYITDRAYRRQEVLAMEQDIIHQLRFKITVPTAFHFVQRFLDITNASPLTRHAACYYTERTLQEHDMLRFRPSLVSASAVMLALNNPDIYYREYDQEAKLPGLSPLLLEYTGFSANDILDCASIIARKVAEEPVTASNRLLIALKKKYDHRKHMSVSTSVKDPCAHTLLAIHNSSKS